MTRQRWSWGCTVLASVLLLFGILAGLVNRNVLDGPQFAGHVDAVRRDPAVASQVGQAITRRVLQVDPDLIALRPLVEAAATSLAGSPAFSGVVMASARQAHAFFTDENPDQVTVRLADVGSALGGILPAISPGAAARVPPDLQVTLVSISEQSFADRTIHLTRVVGLLSWLLPLLALLAFAAGIGLSPQRFRATVRTGWATMGVGLGIGIVALAASVAASRADESSFSGAFLAASWREVGSSLWWAATITVVAGALLIAAASAYVPQLDFVAQGRRLWTTVTRRPERRWVILLRGLALVVVGGVAVLHPIAFVRVLVILVGFAFLVAGVGEISAGSGAERAAPRDLRTRRRRWLPVVVMGVAVALVVTLVTVEAQRADRQIDLVASTSTACEGHVELCSRPYNDVAFAATHNSMAAADEPGWFIPEQPTGLVGQLNDGVRALLIDTWYGQRSSTGNIVVTAQRSYAGALAQAEQEFGPEVVASAVHLRDTFASGAGPVRPYLCHGLCEIGATDWLQDMVRVRAWLAAHPREVVTFIIQDTVTPADTAKVFKDSGLLPYVHTQRPGQPWPTLGQMIDSGHRLVVMMERRGGGPTYPWMLSAFDWVQDTPYTNPTAEDLSCRLNRGSASHPLLLINNWVSSFQGLISNARKVNAYDVLWPYVERCRERRGQIPNFIAVNYYDLGDTFRVVDQLNGVP